MNPFTSDLKEAKLFCVATGRAVSEEVANDILNFEDTGARWCDEFLAVCKDNAECFEKPIRRRKVKNCIHDAVQMKMKTQNQKIKEVRCTRDLFGRLLCVAALQKIDLQKLLAFPLSLCHYHGTMNKTDKSALMRKLEEKTKDADSCSNITDKTDFYILCHVLLSNIATASSVVWWSR